MGWEDPLEEAMTTHSSILPIDFLWTEEPGGLQSRGLHSVGHNRSDLAQPVMNLDQGGSDVAG